MGAASQASPVGAALATAFRDTGTASARFPVWLQHDTHPFQMGLKKELETSTEFATEEENTLC